MKGLKIKLIILGLGGLILNHVLTKVLDYFVEKFGGYNELINNIADNIPKWAAISSEYIVQTLQFLASDLVKGAAFTLLIVAICQSKSVIELVKAIFTRIGHKLLLTPGASSQGGGIQEDGLNGSYNTFSMLVKNNTNKQMKEIDIYATISFYPDYNGSTEEIVIHPINIATIPDVPPKGTTQFEFLGTLSVSMQSPDNSKSASGAGFFFPKVGICSTFAKTWASTMKITYKAISEGVEVGAYDIYFTDSTASFATKKPDNWPEGDIPSQGMGHQMLFRDLKQGLEQIIQAQPELA